MGKESQEKAGHYDTKKLATRTKPKGKEIEVISLEKDLEEFHLSAGDGYETVGGYFRRRIHL